MLKARLVLQELVKCGVSCVAGLPDNSSAALIELLQKDESIRYVPVTREGEAFAVASGFWMGGGEAAVLVQNTGFLESGDSVRGTAQRMRAPILCLIMYRGFGKMPGRERFEQALGSDRVIASPGVTGQSLLATSRIDIRPTAGADTDISPELFSNAAVDSAALVTEPTLRAWGIPFDFLQTAADLPKIAEAFARAHAESRPVALLVTGDVC